MGHVVGAFYDADGRPTPLLLRIEALDGGRGPRGVVQDPTQDLQPCNSGWSQAAGGSRVGRRGAYGRRKRVGVPLRS